MIRFGERLREKRQKKGLSINDAADATKIRVSFISAIERGEYKKLPSGAYIQGFVKNYIEFLGLPKKEYISLFKREFDEQEYRKILPDGLLKHDDISITKIGAGYTFISILLVLFCLVVYIFYQYRFFFINPPLDVYLPKEGSEISQLVAISGKTDQSIMVFVNDIPVVVDQDGSFSKNITLFLGKSIISIKAKSRFGKETLINRRVKIINNNE
ncbi:MAG: helix-turn-helix domain-containing protein [Candidatus Levybacteria bacterium]|nr:helix-turn-helix domain-containing protein [Candidatus Levybacteria bacterium]